MAIVLVTFILAVQEILHLVYLTLLFINDQSELNSLVAKNAYYAPQGISHSSDKQWTAGAIVFPFVYQNHWVCKNWCITNAFLGFAQ